MNTSLRSRLVFSVAVVGLIALSSRPVHAQAQYFVTKAQAFVQTSAAGSVADPSAPFKFSAKSGTSVTFTLPGGSTLPIPATTGNGDQPFQLTQNFSTKAALDAAFPAGTYRMTTASNTVFNLNLTTDSYPSVTPQIVGGTWNAGGLLVVNPTQNTTINFNTFTGYAAGGGTFGHISTSVSGTSDNVDDSNDVLTAPNPFGIPTTNTPLTSITIPAGRLTNGRVYQAEIDFDTGTTFDLTTASGSAGIALFSKTLSFYIVAATSGDGGAATTIIAQPTNQTGVAGGSVTFNIGFTPITNNPSVTWSFNGRAIFPDGNKYLFTNGANLTIRNLTAADVGNYSVTIIGTGGIVTSNTATLTLGVAAAPVIVQPPVAKNVGTGSTVVFSVVATGSAPLSYQWKKDGANVAIGNGIANGISPTLVIQGASATTAGNYSVTVTNSVGSVTSNAVALTTTATSDPGRLTNLSVLTDITAGSSFTVGTVVGGSGTSGNKALVVRAVGPSLGALGVPGTIGDPQLTLFNGSSVAVATNDNWGSDAAATTALTNAMVSVGAFAFTGSTSKDAAVFQPSLTPGNYSVAVSGVNGSVGTAIAEIYDATPAGTFTPSSSRLINVSVLKPIPSGGLLTLGFTIGGSVAKTVLIRVIGPGLAAVGVTNGTLGDPQLALFNSSSTQIASNDDWGADPQLIAAGTRVNAFAIGNTQSKDAMLMITLPAGGYTAQAKGGGGTSGLAIVEVYEVP